MPPSKARQAAAAEKRSKATALRIAGMDWEAIADRVGYASRGAAYTAVNEALKANLAEQQVQVEELRALTVMRYDRLQAAYWREALSGDRKAADVVLKCLTGRAKIEGVEAPTRINVEAETLGNEILALMVGESTPSTE